MAFGDYLRLSVDAAAAEDDPSLTRDLNLKLNTVSLQILGALADCIVNWNWTDAYGRDLPKPDGTADAVSGI